MKRTDNQVKRAAVRAYNFDNRERMATFLLNWWVKYDLTRLQEQYLDAVKDNNINPTSMDVEKYSGVRLFYLT